MRVNFTYETRNHERFRYVENAAWTNGESLCISQDRADGADVELWLEADEVDKLRELLNRAKPDGSSERITLSKLSTDEALAV